LNTIQDFLQLRRHAGCFYDLYLRGTQFEYRTGRCLPRVITRGNVTNILIKHNYTLVGWSSGNRLDLYSASI